MAFVAYRTWTTGELVTAAHMNQDIRDNGDWDHDAHGAHLHLSTGGAAMVSGTTYTMGDATGPGGTFSEAEDTDGYHAAGAFITIPAGLDGVYSVSAQVSWAAGVTGRRELTVEKNSITNVCRVNESAANAGAHLQGCSRGGVRLVATDTLRARVTHTQGANLTTATGEGESFLAAWLVGA